MDFASRCAILTKNTGHAIIFTYVKYVKLRQNIKKENPMRNLTITRRKSFVASLGKMKVYIEDAESNEIKINDLPCRKLGTLKNGETNTFSIDNGSARIFVIADKLSKGYCSEVYTLPEGEEDIQLSGQNYYNPINGNAFRFDGNNTSEAVKNRNKGLIIGAIVFAIVFTVVAGVGLALRLVDLFQTFKVEPMTFNKEGIEITLTDEFIDVSDENYCFATEDVVVLIMEEDFSLVDGIEELSVEEYAVLVSEPIKEEYNGSELQSLDGIPYFEYTYDGDELDEPFYYMVFIYKGEDSFWLINFATPTSEKDAYRDSFFEWAKTFKLD